MAAAGVSDTDWGEAAAPTLPTGDPAAMLTVAVTIINTGDRTGDEVIMCYVIPGTDVNLPQRPVKALYDFQRASDIVAGAARTLRFNITRDDLLLANEGGDMVSTPGLYGLSYENGAGQGASLQVRLVGEMTVVAPFPKP